MLATKFLLQSWKVGHLFKKLTEELKKTPSQIINTGKINKNPSFLNYFVSNITIVHN